MGEPIPSAVSWWLWCRSDFHIVLLNFFVVDSFQEIENNISQELFAAVDLLRAMLFGLCQKEHQGTEWSQNRTEWI